jgi:LCP family protein required for cell wall assembly
VVLAALVVIVLLVASVGYVELDRNIHTFSGKGISRHRPPPTVAGQNILLIGSDTRAGADSSLGGKGEKVGRSDTTLLVHVYQGGRRAVAVSIPRDSLVDIPRCVLPDGKWSQPQHDVMFNGAFSVGQTASGNPACTVNTVEKLTGMRVDHTIVVDFKGFAAMTQIVGGVPVCMPNTVYQDDLDPNRTTRGKVVFHKGIQKVSGRRALDYVRLRHGVGDGSDIGRMRRQQAFLGSVVAKIRKEGITPTHILPLAKAATKYLTVDPGLGSARKLLEFVLSLRHMTESNVVFLTAPWRYDGPRVALVHPDVDRLWKALKNDQPLRPGTNGSRKKPTVGQRLAMVTDPVTVLDAGGPGASRSATARQAAQQAAHLLRRAKVHVQVSTGGQRAAHTVVEYGPGQRAQALALATAFVGARTHATSHPGLRVVPGSRHGLQALGSVAKGPVVKLPKSVTQDARSAATGPCKGISYGAGSTP